MAKRIEKIKVFELSHSVSADKPNWHVGPVQSTNIPEVKKAIIKAIKANNADELGNLLSSDYIYPAVSPDSDAHYMCPILEVLFDKHPDVFHHIVKELIAANNEQLFEKFVSSLRLTDLVVDDLFAWTMKTKAILVKDLDNIAKQRDYLLKENAFKGYYLNEIETNFRELMKDENRPLVNDYYSPQQKLKILDFKLNVLSVLHSKDNKLDEVRGYKKIVANITSALFAFIPNLLNYAITGNFFFANKTASQQIIQNASNHTLRAEIDFSKLRP